MKKFELLAASAIALLSASPAFAQTTPPQDQAATTSTTPQTAPDDAQIGDIVITAQRQSETLQTVPIAVTAFNAQALQAQQINTTSDLQLNLPNVTFTKSNFTSSSVFTIRGVGELCVGATCDSVTAVHVNDVPVLGSPIFQNEYFDMERIEVLRGPQGTLYGRNATGGVVNFITAKPDLSGIHASGDVEYGNYQSLRVKGMFNLPLGDKLGIRVAGYYLTRDGFTKNLFTNTRIDGRNQFDVRASLRFEPTSSTTLDIVAHWFKEDDDRSRIQKQLCHRDPTGVLGCLPDRLATEQVNGNASFAATLSSNEFLRIATGNATIASFGLQSVYGPDSYSGVTNPSDLRTVNVDSLPRFKTNEKQILGSLTQELGKQFTLKIDGGYTEGSTDSTNDYNISVENSLVNNVGLNNFNVIAGSGALGPGFQTVRNDLLRSGNTSSVCQSISEPTGTGVYGGHYVCAPNSLDFDRSQAHGKQWTVEGILTSKLDGPFNFLLGAIYLDYRVRNVEYYVNSFGLDYASGILGSAGALGAGNPAGAYLASPFYQNDGAYYHLKSYGLFGEGYLNFSSNLKLTVGLRYNHDDKFTQQKTSILSDAVPLNTTNAYTSPAFLAAFDADPSIAGIQPYALATAKFSKLTGRAVLDWQITDRNLLYASYSRGYKSGGINPPLLPGSGVPVTFRPEQVDAVEIGSKNTFLNGTIRLNLSAFYYKYKNLQVSRIIDKTAVNDNINADIYGAEAEAVIKPSRQLLVNLNFSYLHTQIKSNTLFINPQDPGGGRADAVVIKDLQNGSNCAVTANNGSAALSNGFVGAVNGSLGLRAPVPIPSTNNTGAFSICSALAGTAAAPPAALSAAFGLPAGTPIPVTVNFIGVPVSIKGNQLPQSPTYKFGAGAQYTADIGRFTLVPRVDLTYTGGYFASIFNTNVNRVQGYAVVNAQVQLNGPDDRFYVRAFVQNLTDNNAITGLYVTDQSSGLFTNAFTLEPRRYGLAAGFRF
ncbi:TonB-dependent receptor [Sphingomonas sp.]|jgi:outer membrane receptor protein involved in Fe transport|uniref:TonB-dependent receptor n=1 Tax=Sphingomonas sp. TaxID=28214 RepID=UPI002E3578D0|nr:TonB-dependent receptor [Sphingomonas sp.]HEX4693873.1 TonB-dependent receptor [Sphingomonas sp.]